MVPNLKLLPPDVWNLYMLPKVLHPLTEGLEEDNMDQLVLRYSMQLERTVRYKYSGGS